MYKTIVDSLRRRNPQFMDLYPTEGGRPVQPHHRPVKHKQKMVTEEYASSIREQAISQASTAQMTLNNVPDLMSNPALNHQHFVSRPCSPKTGLTGSPSSFGLIFLFFVNDPCP